MISTSAFLYKKVLKRLPNLHGYDFVNFSYSAYSFSKDHQYQKESQLSYYKGQKFTLIFYEY